MPTILLLSSAYRSLGGFLFVFLFLFGPQLAAVISGRVDLVGVYLAIPIAQTTHVS